LRGKKKKLAITKKKSIKKREINIEQEKQKLVEA
jgi:hypothetical protein